MTTMTEMVTVPYCSKVFHAIGDLRPSADQLNDLNGTAWIKTVGKDLLKKHGMNETFGIGLLHRHFDIDDNQILVEFNNITLPWKTAMIAPEEDGSTISATSWKLIPQSDDKFAWMPYEFKWEPAVKPEAALESASTSVPIDLNLEKYKTFLEEFSAALRKEGLEKVLGLRVWPGQGFRGGLERTEGKANIFLNPDQYNAEDNRDAVVATWFFDKASNLCQCTCSLLRCEDGHQHSNVTSSGKGMLAG